MVCILRRVRRCSRPAPHPVGRRHHVARRLKASRFARERRLWVVVNPGDKVVVLEPAHENYDAGIAFAGGIPIWVPLRPPELRSIPMNLRAHSNRIPKPCSTRHTILPAEFLPSENL